MNDPKQSLEDFVAASCTHGIAFAGARHEIVCRECAITWACSWAVSTAGATLERAAVEAENHGYDGRRAAAAIRALA